MTNPRLHPITERALETDLSWVEAEDGYIIAWMEVHRANTFYYTYGGGRRGRELGGWTSTADAVIFDSYSKAAAAAQEMIAANERVRVIEADVRIVRVKLQKPVTVLDDLPLDVLDAIAEAAE